MNTNNTYSHANIINIYKMETLQQNKRLSHWLKQKTISSFMAYYTLLYNAE